MIKIKSRFLAGIVLTVVAIFLVILVIVFTITIVFWVIGIPLLIIGFILLVISILTIAFGTVGDLLSLLKRPFQKKEKKIKKERIIDLKKKKGVYEKT